MSAPRRIAFLHGFAGDARAWDDVLASIDPVVDAIRVVLPGHGAPAVATWDDGLAAVGDAIASAEVVVGYSLGARIALGLVATARAPAAVLVGVNPGLPGDAHDERRARAASDAAWAAMLRTRGVDVFADAWEAQPLFATQARAPAARLDARRVRRRALSAEGLASSLDAMGLAAMPGYRDAVAAHAARLHLVVGADDARYVEVARALALRSPALPLDFIAGSGHDPTLEQPVELARVIARALDRLVTNARVPSLSE